MEYAAVTCKDCVMENQLEKEKPVPGVSKEAAFFEEVRRTLLVTLAALLAVCLTFSWRTRDAMEHLPFLGGGSAAQSAGPTTKSIVDLHTWQTAQALAPLAMSAEEVELAREAERLADHETDQAFAAALRLAVPQRRALSPKGQALSKRITDLQAAIVEDQKQLKAATAAGPGMIGTANHAAGPSIGGDEVAIATAQLALDTDELKDAQADLAREVGDDRTRIQQELSAHEAAMSKYDAQSNDPGQVAVLTAKHYDTLAGRISVWRSQRSRRDLLERAEADTRRSVAALAAQHDGLEKQADGTSTRAQNSDQSGAGLAGDARLSDLRQRSAQRQLLSIFDDRIATLQQLAMIYARWSDQVVLQHRIWTTCCCNRWRR